MEYLRDVNPAGTVPVLIHNGHPVYESHEQIVYIDQVIHLNIPPSWQFKTIIIHPVYESHEQIVYIDQVKIEG